MSVATLDSRDHSQSGVGAGRRRALRLWLWTLAAMVLVMVVVGGATRLTGSGLSITEWRPVTGAVPPLSDAAWQSEFDRYRQIPQYQLVNKGMSLDAFKTIYWWEWSHRQLGRAIGLVFAAGFVTFLALGALQGRLLAGVAAAGLLGGLQGAIGWIMVASGLREGMTAVAPVKLMLHLTTASVILALLVGLIVSLRDRPVASAPVALRRMAFAVVVAVLLQIALGALVAGSKAGLTYNTWPLMDGRLIPPLDGLAIVEPWYENLVDNPLTVQFNHRMAAYLLLGLALLQVWRAPSGGARRRAGVVALLVLGQAALGVATLLWQVPLGLGLAHQGLAMVVLAMAVVHWRLLAGVPAQR
ncbi:MAG: COX15/CtaA family protein [Alsobacter sp.]